LTQGQEALSRADNVMDVVSSLSSRVGRVETGSVVVSPTRASPEAAVKAPVELESGSDRVMNAREVSETVMGKVHGEAPPDDPSLSPIKRLDAQMAPSASDASVHQSPKQIRTRSATVVEQVARERARAGAYADTHGEALVAKHGVAGAAAFIASRWSLDDAGRLALERSLELEYGTGSGRVSPPNVGDEGDDDDLQSVDKNKKADGTGGGGVSTPEFLQSDDEGEKFELVEYVHGNRTVSRAELLGEGLNDGKPPMQVRLVETGRMIRADVDRVLRGDEMQEHADVAFASRHASGPLRAAASTASAQRPAPSLSGSVASSLAASARDDASSVAPSLVSEQTKGGGAADDFDIFASIAPPRRGDVPRSLSNPFDMLTGGTSGRSVASSISDVTGSFVSASRLGPSGRDVRGIRHDAIGALESQGGSSDGNVSGEPGRDRTGMPVRDAEGNDMTAQLKMATITFDDDAKPTDGDEGGAVGDSSFGGQGLW